MMSPMSMVPVTVMPVISVVPVMMMVMTVPVMVIVGVRRSVATERE